MKLSLQNIFGKRKENVCDPPAQGGFKWSTYGPLVLLLVMWVAMYFISPHFGNRFNQINILRHASVLMVATAAQTFTVIAGGLNLAIGASVALGAVSSAAIALKFGTAAGYIAGILSGVGTGLLMGIVVGYFKVDPTIGSVGLMTIARGLAFEITKGRPISGLPKSYTFIGMKYIGPIPWLVIVALGSVALAHLFLTYTVWGRSIYAVGSDEDAARLAGIKVRFYKVLAQILSVSLAAWAGVMLSSRAASGSATLAEGMHLETIAAVIIGGSHLFSGEGNVLRATIGVLIIAILGNGMDLAHVSPYFRDMLLGAIVIAVVFVNVRMKPKQAGA